MFTFLSIAAKLYQVCLPDSVMQFSMNSLVDSYLFGQIILIFCHKENMWSIVEQLNLNRIVRLIISLAFSVLFIIYLKEGEISWLFSIVDSIFGLFTE